MSVLIVELLFFFLKKELEKKVMCMEEKVTCVKNDKKRSAATAMVLSDSRENS